MGEESRIKVAKVMSTPGLKLTTESSSQRMLKNAMSMSWTMHKYNRPLSWNAIPTKNTSSARRYGFDFARVFSCSSVLLVLVYSEGTLGSTKHSTHQQTIARHEKKIWMHCMLLTVWEKIKLGISAT